ncbi:MAG: hypothetical protein KBB39_03865 [Phycicoccus sp.]|nr:hypothetical protein [Phycicoccus sp.]
MRTRGGAFELAEEGANQGRRPLGRLVLVVCAVAVAAGLWVGGRSVVDLATPARCEATASGSTVSFAPEQMENASTITAIAVQRGLPARAATIALATAMQESKLYNVNYGDRDSLGLFQQRPSQGWGTAEQVMDPVYATNKFYDALVQIDGYETMEITVVAQEVQRSAAPTAYAQHEPEARVLASTLAGHSPAAFGCRLEAPTEAYGEGLVNAMAAQYGLTGVLTDGILTVDVQDETQAWSVAQWAVAKSQAYGVRQVTLGDRNWTRDSSSQALTWGTAASATAATTVVVSFV